jgi:hypothetical protein
MMPATPKGLLLAFDLWSFPPPHDITLASNANDSNHTQSRFMATPFRNSRRCVNRITPVDSA